MRPRALLLLSVLVALVAALALLGRPEPQGGSAPAGAGREETSAAPDGGGAATWWKRVLRRVGLDSSGPGLRGGRPESADEDDWGDEPPPWVRLVEGVVVDDRGDPVADAEVTRHSPATDHRSPGRVRSGPDGAFRIHVKDGDTDELEARAPGRRSRRVAADSVPLRLQLLAESRLEVVVRDGATREPVRDAGVSVYRGRSRHEKPFVVTTGASGRVSVDVHPVTSYVVRVRAAGFAPAFARTTTVPGEPQTLEMSLGRGAVLRGTVRDFAGGPVVAAQVTLNVSHDPFDSLDFSKRGDPAKTTTDASGRFEFRHVPTGTATLSLDARTAGGARTGRGVAAMVEGEERAVDVTFPEPARVSGRVLRVDGTPVVEGTVRLYRFSAEEEPEATLDEAGAFAFDVVAAGDAKSITATDAAGRWRDVDLSPRGGEQQVTVVIPDTVEGPSEREVGVRVSGADGAPVPRAVVRTPDGGYGTTDSGGVAHLSVGGATSVELRVRPPGGIEQARTVDVPEQGVVEFRLGDGVVAGRILRHDGTPSRSVLVLRRARSRTAAEQILALVGMGGEEASASVLAAADGSFRFTGVGEGEHALSYRESEEHPWVTTAVGAGDTDLVLRIPDAAALLRSFEVEVLDRQETPVATRGVVLALVNAEGVAWQGLLTPAERGVYRSAPDARSASLAPGPYDVAIVPGPGRAPVELRGQTIAGGVHRWTVRVGRTGRLEGVVRGPDGHGVEGVHLFVGPEAWQERGETTTWLERTDAEGRYAIEGIVPGRFELSVRSDRWTWLNATVEVGSAPVANRDFTLGPGGGIEVWPSDGRPPLDEAEVVLRRLGASTTFERAQVARDDPTIPWAEFRNVLPGRLLVTVVVGGQEAFRREVAVEAGGTTVVVVPP